MFRITRYIFHSGHDEPEIRHGTMKRDDLIGSKIVAIFTDRPSCPDYGRAPKRKVLSFIRVKSKSGREFDLINSEPLEICELVDDPHETPGETVPKKEKPNPQGEKDNAQLRLSRQ